MPKNGRTIRISCIWCFVSLRTRARLRHRENPMETNSDGGDGDCETLGLLAIAVASFAKRKHNLWSRTRTVAMWEMLLKKHPDSDGEEEGTAPSREAYA